MSMLAIKAACEPLRVATFPNILTSYTAFGAPFSHPISMLKVDNHTDAAIKISLDGVNDHFVIVSNGYLLWDIGSNKALGQGLFLPEHMQIYIKAYGNITFGEAYLSVSYGSEY